MDVIQQGPDLAVRPDATVLVRLLNHQDYVARQLASLVAQWRPGLQLLLIDNGSADNGFGVALRFLADHPSVPATVLRTRDSGSVKLLPLIVAHAAAPIIIQADGDDISLPGRLDATMACFANDPACRLVTSNAVRMSIEDLAIGIHAPDHPDHIEADAAAAARQLGDTRWLGATAAFHRDVVEAFPLPDPRTYPPMLDLLWPFRALLLGTHHYLATPYVGWRQHGSNAHRTLGVLETGGERLDRYKYLELLVLAQKLRDVQHVISVRPNDPALPPILAHCDSLFFRDFTAWAEFRHGLGVMPEGGGAPPEARPGVPPIATLRSGARLSLAVGGRLASYEQGFYAPEDWGVWTRHAASLCLRLAGDVSRLRLALRLRPGIERQPVKILVGTGTWIEVEAFGEDPEVELEVPGDALVDGCLTLIFKVSAGLAAMDAGIREQMPSPDGVGLRWIEGLPRH